MSKLHLQSQRNADELANTDRRHNRNMKISEQKHRNEVQKMKDDHNAEKESLKQQQKAAISHINLNHNKLEREEMLRHRANMSKLKLQQKAEIQRNSLSHKERSQNLALAGENEKLRLENLKSQYRTEQERTRGRNNKMLQDVQDHNRFLMRQQIAKNQEQQRTVAQAHNTEMHRLSETKEREIKDRRQKFTATEREQKQTHFKRLQREQDFFQNIREHQGKHYRQKYKDERRFSQDKLQSQDRRYKGLFNTNDKANVQSLENQKNRYEEALFDIKKDFFHKAQFYEKREDDPFYQLLDINAKFEEGPEFYEVVAQVPEHEMENFRVRVQKDKISLFATRQHEQEFEKNNEKVGSQNAQTIRQEFSLLHPADEDQVIESYEKGIFRVTVPKIGYFPVG